MAVRRSQRQETQVEAEGENGAVRSVRKAIQPARREASPGFGSSIGVEYSIPAASVRVEAPPGPGPEAEAGSAEAGELDRQPLDLGAEAAASAAGDFGEAEPAARKLTGADLVKLLEMLRAGIVLSVGKRAKLSPERLAGMSKLPPDTRAQLLIFGDDAAAYLPAWNANAPLIGACLFAGIAAFDLWQTLSELRGLAAAERAREQAAAKPAGGFDTEPAGERVRAPILGREGVEAWSRGHSPNG